MRFGLGAIVEPENPLDDEFQFRGNCECARAAAILARAVLVRRKSTPNASLNACTVPLSFTVRLARFSLATFKPYCAANLRIFSRSAADAPCRRENSLRVRCFRSPGSRAPISSTDGNSQALILVARKAHFDLLVWIGCSHILPARQYCPRAAL